MHMRTQAWVRTWLWAWRSGAGITRACSDISAMVISLAVPHAEFCENAGSQMWAGGHDMG